VTEINPVIDETWKQVLIEEFSKSYFLSIKQTLLEEKSRYRIYPPGKMMFNAFNRTPFDKVSVVIIGQDPYHGPGQAHGLCFSVPKGIAQPPSLRNIFREIHSDVGIPVPEHGNLEKWADQGVLLLNAMLSVRENSAGSHQKIGWQHFTDRVIQTISEKKTGVVFLLWGKFAQAKSEYIDTSRHYILTSAHPSPLSAHNGFFGCRHFSKTNDILVRQGKKKIDWAVD
jgi:uracil-DNA glycosylase